MKSRHQAGHRIDLTASAATAKQAESVLRGVARDRLMAEAARAVLDRTFRQAVEHGWIDSNPVRTADPSGRRNGAAPLRAYHPFRISIIIAH